MRGLMTDDSNKNSHTCELRRNSAETKVGMEELPSLSGDLNHNHLRVAFAFLTKTVSAASKGFPALRFTFRQKILDAKMLGRKVGPWALP